MKLLLVGLVLIVIVEADVKFAVEFLQGADAMRAAYDDMKEANYKNSDKYFHARGNADAARMGNGGRMAAEIISDARERLQEITGRGSEDSAADQRANEHGRNGGNPNDYRPKGLPLKY